MTIDNQIKNLNNAVDEMSNAALSLSKEIFLEKIDDSWSPRDIIAHLAGWNRYIIKGSRQLINGELPFYDIDPGENYSNINKALIREYSTVDKDEIVKTLNESAKELAQFLKSIEPDSWDKDYGVRHAGEIITIRNTIDELIEDYTHHTRQLGELF